MTKSKALSPLAVSPKAILFGLSAQKKALFFRQLATMVHSGLPVSRAVHTAAQQGLPAIGEEMAGAIDHGSTLAEAMARFPYHFDRYEIAMAKAGETAGQLDRQLVEVAQTCESNWALGKMIGGKLVYPALVLHASIFLPPLFLLVKDGLEAYLRTVLIVLVPMYVVLIGSLLAYRFFRTHGGPRRMMDHGMSNLPILGTPLRYSARIRFFEALGNLIEAGFLPDQAIPLAADACGNYWLRDQVVESWNVIGKESPISEVLRRSKAFSAVELGLIVSGEEAGRFAPTLKKAAETLKPDFEAHVHRLATVLPILLLFVVGGIVGLIAVKSMMAILAPLNQI
jgi:type II secretory pathway component PulF